MLTVKIILFRKNVFSANLNIIVIPLHRDILHNTNQ